MEFIPQKPENTTNKIFREFVINYLQEHRSNYSFYFTYKENDASGEGKWLSQGYMVSK